MQRHITNRKILILAVLLCGFQHRALAAAFDELPKDAAALAAHVPGAPAPAVSSPFALPPASYHYEMLPAASFSPAGFPKGAYAELGPDERAAEFLFITATLERVYSHLENKQRIFGFSFEALKAEYLQLARAASSTAQYQRQVGAFINVFSDPHLRVFFYEKPSARAQAGPIVTNTLTGDGILLTRIARLYGNEEEKQQIVNGLKESLELTRTARALVVDVRGNPGGNDGYTREYLSRLAAKPFSGGRVTIKISSEALARYGELEEDPERPGWTPWRSGLIKPKGDAPFKGPVALLIDGGCVSSCEGTALMFKFSGIARLYGATTMGSSGYPVDINLPSGRGKLYVPTWIQLQPDGTPIEDRGIDPHVQTSSEEALERALADIREYLAGPEAVKELFL